MPDLPAGVFLTIRQGNGPEVPMEYVEDFNEQLLRTFLFTAPIRIESGSRYTVRATHASMNAAEAEASIPMPFVASVTDTVTTNYAGNEVVEVNVIIHDVGAEKNHYVVEAVKQSVHLLGMFEFVGWWYDLYTYQDLYDSLRLAGHQLNLETDTSYSESLSRINIYTNDTRTENLRFGNSMAANRRILLPDANFDGGSYRLKVFLQKDQMVSTNEWDKGRVLFRIRSVSEDYFRYLKGYEQKNSGGGISSIGQPVRLDGNVVGGLGVIGGVYQVQFEYWLDDL